VEQWSARRRAPPASWARAARASRLWIGVNRGELHWGGLRLRLCSGGFEGLAGGSLGCAGPTSPSLPANSTAPPSRPPGKKWAAQLLPAACLLPQKPPHRTGQVRRQSSPAHSAASSSPQPRAQLSRQVRRANFWCSASELSVFAGPQLRPQLRARRDPERRGPTCSPRNTWAALCRPRRSASSAASEWSARASGDLRPGARQSAVSSLQFGDASWQFAARSLRMALCTAHSLRLARVQHCARAVQCVSMRRLRRGRGAASRRLGCKRGRRDARTDRRALLCGSLCCRRAEQQCTKANKEQRFFSGVMSRVMSVRRLLPAAYAFLFALALALALASHTRRGLITMASLRGALSRAAAKPTGNQAKWGTGRPQTRAKETRRRMRAFCVSVRLSVCVPVCVCVCLCVSGKCQSVGPLSGARPVAMLVGCCYLKGGRWATGKQLPGGRTTDCRVWLSVAHSSSDRPSGCQTGCLAGWALPQRLVSARLVSAVSGRFWGASGPPATRGGGPNRRGAALGFVRGLLRAASLVAVALAAVEHWQS